MHRHAQPFAKARQRLRGQADLRHQHQRLPAAPQAVGDGVQVDLRLAAAGHAVEQEGTEPRSADDRVGGGLLFVVERRAGPRRRGDGGRRGREALRQPTLAQIACGGASCVQVQVQHVFIEGAVLRQQVRQAPWTAARAQTLAPRKAGFRQAPMPGMGIGQRLALAQQHRQGGGHHLAQRGVRIAGQPMQRFQQLAVQQGGRVQQCVRRSEVQSGIGRRADPGDEPGQRPVAEHHAHPLADIACRGDLADRGQVVEQPWQRHGQGDLKGVIGRHRVQCIGPFRWRSGLTQLQRCPARILTKITQVPIPKGDSGLSTQVVDKSVHGANASRRNDGPASIRVGLAKKTPAA